MKSRKKFSFLLLKWLFTVQMSLTVLILNVFAQSDYHFVIIARTGEELPNMSKTVNLGKGPSINNDGHVAFTARDVFGVEQLFVDKSGHPESYTGRMVYYDLDNYIQLNNQDQVVWLENSFDGLFTNIKRLGSFEGDEFQWVAKRHSPPYEVSPFNNLLPWVTMNNKGRIVFSGDVGDDTILCSPKNPNDQGINPAEDYYCATPTNGFNNYFPMISDNDKTIIRSGNDETSPLVLFSDPTFQNYTFVATSSNFAALGERPDISENGNLVVFMGHHQTYGTGIFGVISGVYLFKIAGVERDGNLDPGENWIDTDDDGEIEVGEDSGTWINAYGLTPRVAVSGLAQETPGRYIVLFTAWDIVNNLGLYVSNVYLNSFDPSEPEWKPQTSEPVRVIGQGDEIPGLPSLVDKITVYDPMNNRGELVFWVQTNSGVQAIVRAERVTLESFDANPLYTGPTVLDMISRRGFPPDLDALAGFEPVNLGEIANKEVRAAAADGLTLLFLRLTVASGKAGQVTFSIENDTNEPSGSLWQVGLGPENPLISDVEDGGGDWEKEAGSVGEEITLTVPTHSYNGKTYAFALYRAPRNFDHSVVIGEDTWTKPVRSVTIRTIFSPKDANEPSDSKAIEVTIVRPPVLFVHGTWDRPSSWYNFPLWKQSATANNNYHFDGSPFIAYAPDFEKNNDGRICTNARLILPQIADAIVNYREARAFKEFGINRLAATQADVVAQSVGGPIVRLASQLQTGLSQGVEEGGECETGVGYDPLTFFYGNFRSFYNFGYGYVHKLITLSSTHKGSQLTPHTALVNSQSGGALKTFALGRYRYHEKHPLARIYEPFLGKNRIDCGIVADQNVVSDILQKLRKTTFPSHAIVGSGSYEESKRECGFLPDTILPWCVGIEQMPFLMFHLLSCDNPAQALGPYCREAAEGDPSIFVPFRSDTMRRLVNYVFNLKHDQGAFPSSEMRDDPRAWPIGKAPNYDLTVRLPSLEGGLGEQAVSDIFDMVGEDAAADFVGKLTHLRNFESPEVSKKVEELLHYSTSSQYFDRFPAVKGIVKEFDTEMQLKFPNWLVEAFLKVGYPANSQDSCYEAEALERLNGGELGSWIIR